MFYILPTPIGNIEDITIRTIRILKKSDFILAENVYYSNILLYHYDIYKPILYLVIINIMNIKGIILLLKRLQEKLIISLISKAGTPVISDPGFLLIKNCIKNNIKIECLPGPTAFVPALVISGIQILEFVFLGFFFKKLVNKKIKKTHRRKKNFYII